MDFISGALIGLLSIAVAFVIMYLGESVFQICNKVTGVLWAPVAGVFVVGVLFSFIRTWVSLA